ncbi:HD-GYP domain-containing protein [Bacillus sp. Marseille-P3661]|uniref:HD-GYP domain-containing protein n=1 Tax=Bacillus sp. Marseille-P3661 TaxID=1936234 RepID=UPI000C831D13|nr:HD-GYP domain-containing protein [Bacillus sp. Marseille-P3661]
MRIKPNQLIEGCILSADVVSLTRHPIIPKKSIISEQNIQVIKAFLIKEVQVEPTLVSGEPFTPSEVLEEENNEPKSSEYKEESFAVIYLKAVQAYKKLFKGWQSGLSIDMPIVRSTVLPVLEAALKAPSDIFTFHHYPTEEDYLYHHAISVGLLSTVIAKALNFPKGDCIQIGIAGAMADCGMAKIDPKIFNKKVSLTKQEFEEVKRHPEYSYLMLKQVKLLKDDVRIAVYQHHERIDGSGYPNGLTSELLYPYGRIIAVADVYSAMTSERSYKSKQSPFKVLESILQDQFGKFDIKVVQALTKALANFSSGTRVRLSNNQIGEIVFIEPKSPTRPMIKLENTGEIIQLTNHRQLYIEEIL